MTHFLLAALIAGPLNARLSLPVVVIANVIIVADAARAAVNGADYATGAPLPLQAAIRTAYAANAHWAGRAERRRPSGSGSDKCGTLHVRGAGKEAECGCSII